MNLSVRLTRNKEEMIAQRVTHSRILMHVEGDASNGIWFKVSVPEVMDEPERASDKGGCSRELRAARGGRVISVAMNHAIAYVRNITRRNQGTARIQGILTLRRRRDSTQERQDRCGSNNSHT